MTTTVIETEEQSKPLQKRECPICHESAEIQDVERLPGNATLQIAIHDDKTYCKWPLFDDFDALDYERDKGIKIEHCPECDRPGIAGTVREGKGDIRNRTQVSYRVNHRGIKPAPKKPYCYIKTQKDRDFILRKFDRYLDTPKIDIIHQKPKVVKKEKPKPEPKLKSKAKEESVLTPEQTKIVQKTDKEYFKKMQDLDKELEQEKQKYANLRAYIWKTKKAIVKEWGNKTEEDKIIPLQQINEHIIKAAEGLVSARYVRECLPAKYKNAEQSRRRRAGGGKHHPNKKPKWNIEKLDKVPKKVFIELCKRAHDQSWGKEFEKIAQQVLEEMRPKK